MKDLSDIIKDDFNLITAKNLAKFKRKWSKKTERILKDSDVLNVYRKLVKRGEIEKNLLLENRLRTKKVRSMSGVTAMAVMTKPFNCPGQCIYCPLEIGMPKSYLSDEPAAQRAKALNFDPGGQIKARLEQLKQTGHKRDKLELIVIGGTFSAYPEEYKREFFKGIFDACNGKVSETLEEAQNLNEKSRHRIVGISIETRPDWVTESEVRLLRELGVTKLQLGVQAFDEKILQKIKRGHSLEAVAKATEMLRDAGFKICYHLMPNLPGSTPEKDIEMAEMMYTDPRFKPDFVKIYPAMVIPGTELHKMWERGEFKTYGDDTLKKVLKEIKKITPEWVRIDRLVRDISKKWVSSGTKMTNMRQLAQEELKKEGTPCMCIRCREVKMRGYDEEVELLNKEIVTRGGKEIFLSFEKEGKLYSLLRLRLPELKSNNLFAELEGAAIIREVHTFGAVAGLLEKMKDKSQHQGLGKKLIEEAERIVKERGYRKMAVISAIGTRDYYRKWGYELEGLYMTKVL